MTIEAADDNAVPAAAVEELRAELEGLVRIAARRPQLVLRTGEPGCTWSFSWRTDVVTVDPEHLRTLAPDLCRGLALHEAAHAAVTVLQRIIPETVLLRLMPLLNTIEDIRIEIWMRSRFPGAAAWIRAYNDVFYGYHQGRNPPRSRQVQFLAGILELWWYGRAASATLPEVVTALATCREPIGAAVACQPPLEDDPAGIVASQRAMWEIVRHRIEPVWTRLVLLDRREGIGPLAAAEMERFSDLVGGGMQRHRGPARMRPRSSRRQRGRSARRLPRSASRCRPHAGGTAGTGGPPSCSPTHAPPESHPVSGPDQYLEAWRRVAPAADRLADELLRVLVPRQRLRWSTGHPWGPRLDLRRALQFEADPRHSASLWCRPHLPHRRDPAVLLLVDRSSSMQEHERIDRALEGTVLLAEVCQRIGVPASVWSFADTPCEEISHHAAVDENARRRLGMLPARCRGNTDMAAALVVVGRAFAERRGDPKLLFVISDGLPNDPDATLAAVRQLEAAGIFTVGLGLGTGTEGLSRYFSKCVTEIPPERLVDHVAELLGTGLLAHA